MTTETKEKEKKPDFDPGDVSDIYDKLSNHSVALRAFGALLRSSGLNDFADAAYGEGYKHEASNMRWGLSQIIELYLSHQERILSEHLDEYHKTDTALIKRARISISMVEQRAFVSREVTANKLRSTISDLDIVINRNGDLQETALQLKGVCLKYIQQLTEKCKTGD
jgi:hypothetical protein